MLAAHPELDVVCICTPNGLHSSQAIQALEAGHHVVIEKPMALSRLDGEKVLHKALEVGKQVFCVMQNRYSPPSHLAQREWSTLGVLGADPHGSSQLFLEPG